MNDKLAPRFFLGANSISGFVSFFDNALNDSSISRKFIFKGGAGCGKSTAMRKIAIKARESLQDAEMIHCASDPRSLDAVILRQSKCALFDGTAPHSIDLQFPSIEGDYILPPEMKSMGELQQELSSLSKINSQIKNSYAEVFHITAAAGALSRNIRFRIDLISNTEKLARRADGIIKREIPKKNGVGQEYKRFLSGITPDGPICFYDTASALADRIYTLNDSFGFSNMLLEPILHATISRGYNAYACYSPLLPDMLEHVIIPQLSLAFITCPKNLKMSFIPYRKINIDGVVDVDEMHKIRPQIKLMQKITNSLITDACDILSKTKSLHDELEQIYRPHLNIEALGTQVEALQQTIFNT